MINRYTLINIDYLTSSFNFSGESQVPIYNAFPTRKLPVIALNNSKNITCENWGSTSEYSKNNNLPNRLISVSLSKISKSNIYLNQFKTERCLIPCDGFFLWKNYFSKNKTPFYFNCIKEKLIFCVGVRDSFQDFNGKTFSFFYFITEPSSGRWRDFTSILPVTFDMRYYDIWLDKKSNLKKIQPFINKLKYEDFKGFSVSPYFVDNNKDDQSLVKPIKSLNQYGNYSLFD